MKKTIRLTESELIKVIKRIIKEEFKGDSDIETMPYKKKTGFDPDEILKHIKELQKKDEERRKRIERQREEEEKKRWSKEKEDDNDEEDDQLVRPNR